MRRRRLPHHMAPLGSAVKSLCHACRHHNYVTLIGVEGISGYTEVKPDGLMLKAGASSGMPGTKGAGYVHTYIPQPNLAQSIDSLLASAIPRWRAKSSRSTNSLQHRRLYRQLIRICRSSDIAYKSCRQHVRE